MDPKEIIIKNLDNLINDYSKFDIIKDFQIPQHDLKLKYFYNF
jgi:hypothetical protein